MTVSDYTIAAECSKIFCQSFGKKGPIASKKMAENQEKLWKLEQVLVLFLHLDAPLKLYQHCQLWQNFILFVREFT